MDISLIIRQDSIKRVLKKNPDIEYTFLGITRFPASGDYEYFMSQNFPKMTCQNYVFPEDLADFNPPVSSGGKEAFIYVFNSILWNFPDAESVSILRFMADVMKNSPSSMLLVNDLLSPPPGCDSSWFGSDKAYRRRDVTVMTMHNAKIRTQREWRDIFLQANPDFKVSKKTLQGDPGIQG